MITIYIDNKPCQVQEGQNLLHACLSLGFDLPYFCWHPAMHSVGACRQGAVKQFKDEKETRGRIVMSCMTPVAEGMRISIDDPDARAFRASVTEFLMANHPHDCPVCDEGGECHLQDMTVMTGHNYRHTRFRKRTHRNQDLGPFLNHEMNRCIACYRCVRFYRDYAGGRDLDVFACHDSVYFGRHADGALESEFSGNLVEVCPTGVFTDKPFKDRSSRKWDLQTAPSVCVHCGLGCNTIAGERYGTLRRIRNRYNGEVNGYFLCDRGRFGYGFVNSEERVTHPLVNGEAVPGETAVKRIAEMLGAAKNVIAVGSPRASLEANFTLRALVGEDNFYSGMATAEHRLVKLAIDILGKGPARAPSLRDVESADAVFVLGEDVTNTAPLLDLALRQAIRTKPKESAAAMRIPLWDDKAVRNLAQNAAGPLYLATPKATKLDGIATRAHRTAPADIARLGHAVAHEIDPHAPAADASPEVLALAREIARDLKNAKRPLILSGTGLLQESVIQAAANVAWALCAIGKPAELCFVLPECNSMGAGLLGGKGLDEAMERAEKGNVDAVIILENDLSRRDDETRINTFFKKAKQVIVIDHLRTPTAAKADVLLPTGTFAESNGTLVNNEGRAQRFYRVYTPQSEIRESRQWINAILEAAGKSTLGMRSFDALVATTASTIPILSPMKDAAPQATYRFAGLKVPRQPHRYSGRTAMLANVSLHEPKPPDDPDTPLAFSMEGYEGRPPAPLISRYWSPGWNSVQSLNKFQQEIGGPLQGGDPGKRLIEPEQDKKPTYFSALPAAGEQAFVPEHHIFGSEELSAYAAAIRERMKMQKAVS